jgi:hypothetical protein
MTKTEHVCRYLELSSDGTYFCGGCHKSYCLVPTVEPKAVPVHTMAGESIDHWWKCAECHARMEPQAFPDKCPWCETLRPSEKSGACPHAHTTGMTDGMAPGAEVKCLDCGEVL